MAQIKLGMGLTDIKGKVGGSVFSSNKNGKYFRNNSVGGGRESQIWDTKKTILGSVAQIWRTLSEGQRAAWNLAATQLPRQNLVGDTVFWSGFNYFSSVNSKRRNLGGDIITLPPELTSFPNIEEFEVKLLPYEQFLSRQSMFIESDGDAMAQAGLELVDFDPPAIGEPAPPSSIWFDVDWYDLCMSSPNCSYDICTDTYGIDTSITFSIKAVKDGALEFVVTRRTTGDTDIVNSIQYDLKELLPLRGKPLIVVLVGGPVGAIFHSLAPEHFMYDVSKPSDSSLSFTKKIIHLNPASRQNAFPITMVSLLKGKFTLDTVLPAVSGYISPLLSSASTLSVEDGPNFANDIRDSGDGYWRLFRTDDVKVSYRRTRQIIKPVLYLSGLAQLEDGMMYQVDYSPAISKGRGNSNSRYKFGQLVNSLPHAGFPGNTALLLEGWGAQPYMTEGSAVSVRVCIVNAERDQKTTPVKAASKDGPRFKGGSTLSESAN